jgi:methylenetetrahydrofolate dehydrogenase (NADP+)/methenyltetrahydrofolate cyclohydrolase
MKTIIFDGKAFAEKKEKELVSKVKKLKRKGIAPKLVSILIGDDPASAMYMGMKKRVARRIGCKLAVIGLKQSAKKSEIIKKIKYCNSDRLVHGTMIQLPLPGDFTKKDRSEIINSIVKKKAVEGLQDDSQYLTPTVKSVLYVLKEASQYIVRRNAKVLIVGYTGFEGAKIYKVLQEMEYEVDGADLKTKDLREKTKKADILISVTGSSGIIKEDMVKEGVVIIDVGAPKGDVVKDEIMSKASFFSPVPGGIGPVTIVSLFENLVEACL